MSMHDQATGQQIALEDIPTSLNVALDRLVQELQSLDDLVGVADGLAAVTVGLDVLGHAELARVYRALAVVVFTLEAFGDGDG